MTGTQTSVAHLSYRGLVSLARDQVEVVSAEQCHRVGKVFRHQNLYRKLAFFLVREGFLKVWQKYGSSKFGKALAEKEVFLIIKDKGSGHYYGGFQFSIDQPIYYFLPESRRESLPSRAEYEDLISFEPYLEYRPGTVPSNQRDHSTEFKPILLNSERPAGSVREELVLIGCGDYVRTTALPPFVGLRPRMAVEFNYEILNSPHFNHFETRTNDFEAIEQLKETDEDRVAIIATYHSYHASQAVRLLEMPRCKVILEKPPCVTRDDLVKLLASYDPKRLFVGYNRRHIPWNHKVKELMASSKGPFVANIQITEIQLTPAHWYFAPTQGTRVCGNLCHWVDLAVYLMDCPPVSISIARNPVLGIDGSVFTLHFEDGSIFTFGASDYGDGTHGVQETIRIRSEELDIQIHDYVRMSIWHKGRRHTHRAIRRDKGHARMYRVFRELMASGKDSPYTRQDLARATLAYISMVELFQSGRDSMVLDFEALENDVSRCAEGHASSVGAPGKC